MQVVDIVNKASMKSGVVSSFNPDEVPEDVQQTGADILRNEIIPAINCDRTLDITEVPYRATPVNGIFDLVTPPQDYPNEIVASVQMTCGELLKTDSQSMAPMSPVITFAKGIIDCLVSLGLVELIGPNNPYAVLKKTDDWPQDQLGNYRDIAVWTMDYNLVEISADSSKLYNVTDSDMEGMVNRKYNVPFAPMRVDEIFRESDGGPLSYVHMGEFVSAEFRYATLVFTTEDLPDRLRIRFGRNFGGASATLILPVPVTVINTFREPEIWQGEVIAPRKFYPFLVALLSYRMAVQYGMSTELQMKALADNAYQALLKNPSKREHKQDLDRRIFTYLNRGRGWKSGSNGNGYAGGFYG
jgi:hypothetical protein